MKILDFKTVEYLEFDKSLISFDSYVESEVGLGGTIVINIGNYDKPYYVNIDPITGKWSWTSPVPLPDGEYSISFQAIDLAGNISPPALCTIIIDTTSPVAPTLLNMSDDQGIITGSFDAGKMTDDRRPKLTGIAEKGTIVYLKEGNTILGSALADKSTGLWSIEPTRDLSDGSHHLTLVSTEIFAEKLREGEVSEAFTIIIGDDPITPAPGVAEITHALDNAGSATGKLISGALTDDTTPELHGTANAGSTVRIQYRNGNGSWIDGGNAQLEGSNWSWTPNPALGEGSWEFRANAGSSWSDEFKIDIDRSPTSEITITHAWDDFGALSGLIGNGGITDDRTPTLHGRAESNSVVYIHYRNALGSWELLDSITTGNDGRWEYETDRLLPGDYEFQAGASLVRNSATPPFKLKIVAAGGYTPTIDYVWDDVGNLTQIFNNGITDDTRPTLTGSAESNSTVVITYIKPVGGFFYSATVHTDESGRWNWTPDFPLSTDLNTPAAWQFFVNHFGSSNISAAFNLTIGNDIVHYVENFESESTRNFDLSTPTQYLKHFKIEMYNKGAGNYSSGMGQTHTDPAQSPSQALLLGKTGFKITLNDDLQAKNISFKMGDLSSWGSLHETVTIKYYDINNIEIGSGQISASQADAKAHFQFSQEMANGKLWHSFIIYHEGAGAHNGQWVWLDNLEFDAQSGVNTPKVQSDIHSSEEIYGLITIDENHELILNKKDLITQGAQNLFISNGKTQLMVNGKIGDTVKLEDILLDGVNSGHWHQQPGTVTVGGMQYYIYRNGDVELLVQQGVSVEQSGINNRVEILDFRTVDYLEIDKSQPTLAGTASSEKGLGGLIAINIGNYDQTYYANIDPLTGAWSWTPPVPLADGEYSISFQAIDLAGNISPPALCTIIIDTTSPVAPTLLNMSDDQGIITGSFDAGKMTDDRRPKLTGIAEKGTIVYLKEGNTILGSALADKSTGLWSIEPTRDLSDGSHHLTLVSTEIFAEKLREGEVSEAFTIIIGDDPITPAPGVAEITHALDNAGSATGKLISGALTDDTTPELHGTANAGSTVRIQYRNGNGSWIDGGNAQLEGSNWSWTPNPALGEGSWEFRANAGSSWSDEFKIDIDRSPTSEITITHAWDDFGALSGLIGNGGITDDRTPTLHGRAESNSVVYIHYRNALGSWELLDSITTGNDGRWEYETDRLLPGDYEFQAGASLVRNSATPPFKLKIVAAGGYTPTIDYVWDDVGNLTQIFNNGITDDTRPTLTGSAESNSTVVITYIKPVGGFFYSATVHTDESGRWNWTPDFPLSTDLNTPAAWQFFVNHFGSSNTSAAFNLTIGNDIVHYSENFESESTRFFDINTPAVYLKHFKIEMYNKGAGSYQSGIGSSKAPSQSLQLGKTGFKITLNDDLQAKNIAFTMGDLTSWGNLHETITIKYYDLNNNEIGSSRIVASPSNPGDILNFSQEMTNGNLWHSLIMYQEGAGDGAGQWVWIDNLEFDAQSGSRPLNTPSELYFSDEMKGLIIINEDHKMVLNKMNLLAHGEQDLFIDNGKTQLMVNGKAGDTVKLEDILQDSDDTSNWCEQAGTVTIAGMQYQVYSNGEAELLVQDGIKTELI